MSRDRYPPFDKDFAAEHTLELNMPKETCPACGHVGDGHIHLSRAKSGVPKEERHGWPLPANEPGRPFCPGCGVSLQRHKHGGRCVACPIWCHHAETPATLENKLCTLQRDLGRTINIIAGLYEGQMRLETYGPMTRQEERAGKILGRLVELIVKEQPR